MTHPTRITSTLNLPQALREAISRSGASRYAIVTDSTVARLVLPMLSEVTAKAAGIFTFEAGEESKNIDTTTRIWRSLVDASITRSDLVVNIGGGVATDMGGFAAATFKRGVACINVPTSLLGAVDAAAGGKTGIDFMGLKNEVGCFHHPLEVIIDTSTFATLPAEQILSGYAEMLKTGLIAGKREYEEMLQFEKATGDSATFNRLVEWCVRQKMRIVDADPTEKGLRKVLNFGHTVGHAIETHALTKGQPMPHGYAVGLGMAAELYISSCQQGLSMDVANEYLKRVVIPYYAAALTANENDISALIELMGHDKKNSRIGKPSFTLLQAIGEPHFDCHIPQELIASSLHYLLSAI